MAISGNIFKKRRESMEEYRVIIAGGRDFKDYDTLLNTVDSLLEI